MDNCINQIHICVAKPWKLHTVETLYSTIYYSKYFIELNFDKSTYYVALWTHKRHPFRASYGVSFMSTLTEIDRVIKGFYCMLTWKQSPCTREPNPTSAWRGTLIYESCYISRNCAGESIYYQTVQNACRYIVPSYIASYCFARFRGKDSEDLVQGWFHICTQPMRNCVTL